MPNMPLCEHNLDPGVCAECSVVRFSWNPSAPGCEKNNCRCPRCGCLHFWVENAPSFCGSCGIEFVWAK